MLRPGALRAANSRVCTVHPAIQAIARRVWKTARKSNKAPANRRRQDGVRLPENWDQTQSLSLYHLLIRIRIRVAVGILFIPRKTEQSGGGGAFQGRDVL